jgi:hypothetical protein
VPTVVVMLDRRKAATMAVPRGLVLRFPFGRPFGAPGNPDQQRVVLEDALALLSSAKEPGEIRSMPYRWRREDYGRILAERRAAKSAGS